MKTIYQLVSLDGARELTREELEAEFTVTGREEPRTWLRPELQTQPAVAGFIGPMWGGWRDDAGYSVWLEDDRNPAGPVKSYSDSKGPVTTVVIRYETESAYDLYSR